MKPVPAIVEPAFDADLVAEQVIVALADLKNIENKITRVRGQLDDAIAAAKMRRIELGRWLSRARTAWPERGPNAKGWGLFLARVKIAESTARMYMDEFKDPKGFADRRAGSAKTPDAPDDDKPANVHGGSGETERGTYCTPKKWADAVGPWYLDPFSNPRSHVVSVKRCMLENGGNGLLDRAVPGSYSAVPAFGRADEQTRVWLQPPYAIVEEAIAHYKHTRFCALLRFAPDTRWFAAMWPHVHAVAIPFGERLPFEIDGVEADGAPFPHAFYYADERDVTDGIRKLCLVWRVDHSLDCAQSNPAALHVVR